MTRLILSLSLIVMLQGDSWCIFPDVHGAHTIFGQFEFKNGAVVVQEGVLTIEKWMVIR